MVSSFAVFEQNTFICWLWCRRLVVEHKSFRSLLRCANICGIAFTSCSFLSIPYPRIFSSIIPYPEDSPFKIFTTLRFFREFLTGYSWWRLRKSIWKKKNPNNETKTKRTSKHRKRGSIVLIKIARCEGLGTSGEPLFGRFRSGCCSGLRSQSNLLASLRGCSYHKFAIADYKQVRKFRFEHMFLLQLLKNFPGYWQNTMSVVKNFAVVHFRWSAVQGYFFEMFWGFEVRQV